MKKTIVAMMFAVAASAAFASDVLELFIAEDRAPKGSPVELGVWNGDLDACKATADQYGVPMIAVWSNKGCAHCEILEKAFRSDVFRNWAKTCGMVLCFTCSEDPHGKNTKPESDQSRYYWFCKRPTMITNYPFVRFYWYKDNGKTKVVDYSVKGDTVDKQQGVYMKSYDKAGNIVIDYIMNTSGFGKYVPVPLYQGGEFADPDTECNRLEFEAGTAAVDVRLARTGTSATNVTLVVRSPAGKQLAQQTVQWSADETEKSVSVAITSAMRSACTKDGQQLTLALSEGGEDKSVVHVTYVDREPSAANPLWIGERKAPGAKGTLPGLQFGEWTMDLDLAKQVVKSAAGDAYTLVSIQGSMWCPDCANTDRNFLEKKDPSGNNLFRQWAASHNVALVSMDVPNYSAKGPTPDTVASPTLFSKKTFTTALARAKEYPQSGADASLTNGVERSGLGYLTRKNVTDEQASEVMAKFLRLATTNTDKGGFHRPEDTNQYRTGVPIFVLLRKDGSVAARFTRFASSSPMAADQANFDNYIKRFEEMLAIAGSGVHGDAGEIENNYPGEGAIPFAANGGTAVGELCNADFQDAFKLVGVGGNADQKVTVKGASDAQVTVQFWQKTEDGSFKTIGSSSTGKLSEGVSLTQPFTQAGDYYLLVNGASIMSGEFDAASPESLHFIRFEVKGSTVLVPQEDRVTANAPEGSDKVVIRMSRDVVYCVTGITTNDNPFLVEVAESSPFRFVRSTASGDLDVNISTGLGGEVSYQIWKPGRVGFVETARSVPESVNDLDDDWVEFRISRTGGKSGWLKARVTVDAGKTTIAPDRYVFETNALNAADFVWEDGETRDRVVRVKIIDDEFYDGDFDIAFNLEVLASDADDVTVVDGRNTFTLTVVEDDKNVPGRCLITGTTPECARKGTVYARESEGAKVWVERIEASSGLVLAEITSSVPGTTFETESPRDMTNILGRTYIYWSSREMDEKYVQVGNIPAGKTARIQLNGVGAFKSVSASNTVTIVSVADDAPAFASPSSAFDLYRYLAVDSSVTAAVDKVTLKGGTVTFTKLSGTLPAGLRAAYDAATANLAFSGSVTAKPGVYKAVYQVVETRSGRKVPGLTTELTFNVADPTDPVTNPEGANPSVAKTRTFKDLPVVNVGNNRLVGVLQLTIPAKGNVSGKYTSAGGTVSLSAKGWTSFDGDSRMLSTTVSNARSGMSVAVSALANGGLDIVLEDPAVEGTAVVNTDGVQWTAANPADDWSGYYTIALPVENVRTNATDDLAPTGTGYLTLNFTDRSSLKSGTVKWAGMLPNGTAVSGSTALGSPYEGTSSVSVPCRWANLPVFRSSTTDLMSVYLKIREEARSVKDSDRRVIWPVDEVIPFWTHGERNTEAADYLVDLGAYGAYYDKSEDLGACCLEYYQTQSMVLSFDTGDLKWTSRGAPDPVDTVPTVITSANIVPDQDDLRSAGATWSFNRSTGIVSGSVKLPCGASDYFTARYKGILLTGWGEGCGCGDSAGLRTMPFVNGAFYYTDRINAGRSVSVKRGGNMTIDIGK